METTRYSNISKLSSNYMDKESKYLKDKFTESASFRVEQKLSSIQKFTCNICLENFSLGDQITTLPCIHMFHLKCLSSWLKKSNKCPLCITEVTKKEIKYILGLFNKLYGKKRSNYKINSTRDLSNLENNEDNNHNGVLRERRRITYRNYDFGNENNKIILNINMEIQSTRNKLLGKLPNQ